MRCGSLYIHDHNYLNVGLFCCRMACNDGNSCNPVSGDEKNDSLRLASLIKESVASNLFGVAPTDVATTVPVAARRDFDDNNGDNVEVDLTSCPPCVPNYVVASNNAPTSFTVARTNLSDK